MTHYNSLGNEDICMGWTQQNLLKIVQGNLCLSISSVFGFTSEFGFTLHSSRKEPSSAFKSQTFLEKIMVDFIYFKQIETTQL